MFLLCIALISTEIAFGIWLKELYGPDDDSYNYPEYRE